MIFHVCDVVYGNLKWQDAGPFGEHSCSHGEYGNPMINIIILYLSGAH